MNDISLLDEVKELRSQLKDYECLKDNNNLHQNLLHGQPSQLTKEHSAFVRR